MRCKSCDHVLWNQPASAEGRVCSECGAPYSAVEFRFGRGKVRFCCPVCDTGYYGTSPEGHLEPPRFGCVSCGTELTMDACIIRPHDPTQDHEAMQFAEIPWLASRVAAGETRRRFTRLRAWWQTLALGFVSPDALSDRLVRTPRFWPASLFLLLTAWGSALAATLSTLGMSLVGLSKAQFGPVERLIALGLTVAGTLAFAMGLCVFALIPALLASGVPRRGNRLGFARAYELIAYSSGPIVLAAVPCCGALVGPVFWLISASRAVSAGAESPSATIAACLRVILGFVLSAVALVAVMRMA